MSELNIREHFKKDYKLSCPILDNDYCFHKSLKIFNFEQDWEDYLSMALKYTDFDNYRKNIRQQIINTIQNIPGFDQLKPRDSQFPSHQGPRTYLRPELHRERLLSIDLVKGNYQSLKYIHPKYVLYTKCYEELIRKFTDQKSLINSKYFRQLIFGLLKPEVFATVQRNMINHIIYNIKKYIDLPIEHISSDEVIVRIQSDKDIDLINKSLTNIPYDYRLTDFIIIQIPNQFNDPWFLRVNTQGNKTIMSVHVRYLFQVYNHINKMKNKDEDFYWKERDILCKQLEPIKFKFTHHK